MQFIETWISMWYDFTGKANYEMERKKETDMYNIRKVTDDMALYFYEISKIPQRSYYKALAAVSVMNYKKTAYAILKDKVNKNNIDEVLEEWNDFISHKGKDDRKTVNNFVDEI